MALVALPDVILAKIVKFASAVMKPVAMEVIDKYDQLCACHEELVRLRGYATIYEEGDTRFRCTLQPGLEFLQKLQSDEFPSTCRVLREQAATPPVFIDVDDALRQLRQQDKVSIRVLSYVAEELPLTPSSRERLRASIWTFAALRESLRQSLVRLAVAEYEEEPESDDENPWASMVEENDREPFPL